MQEFEGENEDYSSKRDCESSSFDAFQKMNLKLIKVRSFVFFSN
jgi:hypothetical protein